MASSHRLAYRLYQSLWVGLDWIFPPTCGGCDQRGARWCSGCHQSTQVVPFPICPICGQNQPTEKVCPRCETAPPAYSSLRSWAVFGGKVRNALHRLKYRRDVGLGDALARPLIAQLMDLRWPLDLVTPVPLGSSRMVERGYNQAALLARPLALALGIPYRPRALHRQRETRSQVGLSVDLRKENVAGAFRGQAELVKDKTVLVIDDVTTSGATLDACAVSLKQAGARAVYGMTLARAMLNAL